MLIACFNSPSLHLFATMTMALLFPMTRSCSNKPLIVSHPQTRTVQSASDISCVVAVNSIKDMYTVETWRKTVCGLDGLHQTCHGVMIAVLTHIGLPDCITRKW